MDAGLENVIRQALEDARAAGRDHLAQTEEAVRAGRGFPFAPYQGLIAPWMLALKMSSAEPWKTSAPPAGITSLKRKKR